MTASTTTLPRNAGADCETKTEHEGFDFKDMHLAVGDRVQIECPTATGTGRAFVRVIGYVDHVSVLVTAPMIGSRRIDLVENDLIVVRAFSRKSAFAFRASVLRTCRLPCHYVHLSYPESVQGSVIRKATRVRTELPVTVGTARGGDPATGTVMDISATGLMLRTRAMLGTQGSRLRLQVELPLHGVDTRLELDAIIRNVREEEGANGVAWHYGVDFHELGAHDHMLVKSFVYQTIIEQPRQII